MKEFRICNNKTDDWYEVKCHNQIEVFDKVSRLLKNGNYEEIEVEWKTPITGEYSTLMILPKIGKEWVNPTFDLPKCFGALVNRYKRRNK